MRYSLKKQLGFIYLTTGANGTGKTLFTLEDVRKRQVEESRPVYYHGFDMVPKYEAEFGWKKCEPEKWQQLPQGSIILLDEVHNQMPKRPNGSAVPPFIAALAEHRKHGFDFYLLTQHPSNLDPFLIKIIGAPGHHRHIKRPGGAQLSSVITWNSVNMNCDKPASGKSGEVTMRAYPKKVYDWYTSSVMHTGKRSIPKQVWVLGLVLVLVPLLGFYGYKNLMGITEKRAAAVEDESGGDAPGTSKKAAPDPAGDYFASYLPRVPGIPHTAPRFDEVTAPKQAPYPAACIVRADSCYCYTQQGTKLPVPDLVCRQIVDGGFFMEWLEPPGERGGASDHRQKSAPLAGAYPPGRSVVPAVRQAGDVTARPVSVTADHEVLAFMRSR